MISRKISRCYQSGDEDGTDRIVNDEDLCPWTNWIIAEVVCFLQLPKPKIIFSLADAA